MGRLIIAEKHSVAQAIAAALGGGKAEDGWIGCGADAVTWAQGHLVDLLTPDEYQDRGWDKWSMDALPLDPTGGWKWKVNRQRGADRQYRVVAGLLKSDAYDVLVNACDPDREGESIFHRIVSYAGTRKPMLRLWVASLEEDAIRDALDSMRSEDEYWTGNGVLDRFLEDESLFGEFLRTPVSEGGVESLVVEPPHIVVEVGA